MVLLIVVTLALIAACVGAFWPTEDDGSGAAHRRVRAAPTSPAADVPAAGPQTLEGILVAQLVSGQINRNQYQRAMMRLAANDDERHPFAVPPDSGCADA